MSIIMKLIIIIIKEGGVEHALYIHWCHSISIFSYGKLCFKKRSKIIARQPLVNKIKNSGAVLQVTALFFVIKISLIDYL